MKNLYYFFLLFALLFGSCYDDEGNYDYRNLNEIKIDTTGKGIQKTYSIYQFEKLSIPLVVSQIGGDTANLEYAWTVYPNDENVDNREKPLLLSTRPAFDEVINLKSGAYIILLTVTDRTTGVKEEMKFGVNVSALLKSGWLVFYEDGNGQSDVAIINDRILDQSITSDEVLLDLFSRVNGRKLKGSPRDINHLRLIIYPKYMPSIYILTDQEGVRVNDQDFSLYGSVGDFFFLRPSIEDYHLHTVYAYGTEFIINQGKIHKAGLTDFSAADQKKFQVEVYGDYYAEPWIAGSSSGSMSPLFYDRSSKKFRFVDYAGNLLEFGVQSGNPAFDVRNVGMDMLYMESGYNALTLALFEDADHRRYLLECDFNNMGAVAKSKHLFSGCEGAEDARFFSVGNKGPVFMYADERNVYAFDYASQVISSQKQWTVPVGQEKITCMKLFRGNPMAVVPGPYSYNPNTPYMLDMESKLIFIATYNESTGEGFVYRCNIDPTTGVIDRSTEVKYKGFGKVKAMAHKAPNTNKG